MSGDVWIFTIFEKNVLPFSPATWREIIFGKKNNEFETEEQRLHGLERARVERKFSKTACEPRPRHKSSSLLTLTTSLRTNRCVLLSAKGKDRKEVGSGAMGIYTSVYKSRNLSKRKRAERRECYEFLGIYGSSEPYVQSSMKRRKGRIVQRVFGVLLRRGDRSSSSS